MLTKGPENNFIKNSLDNIVKLKIINENSGDFLNFNSKNFIQKLYFKSINHYKNLK